MAGAGLGRVDDSGVDGRLVVFEMNANPAFAGDNEDDLRPPRRELVRDRLIGAMVEMDRPVAPGPPVPLRLPMPRSHDLPRPLGRLRSKAPRVLARLRLSRGRSRR